MTAMTTDSHCKKMYARHAFGIFCLVSSCFAQNLSVSAVPAAITIFPGQQNIPVQISAGSSTYAGPLTVTLTGLPSGVTVAPLVLTAGSSGTLLMSATVSAGQEGFSTADLGIPTSWTTAVTVICAAGSIRATAPLSLTVSISNPAFAPSRSAVDLPIVSINTNGAGIISKTIDVPGTITITSADGQTQYLPSADASDNSATFHVHGNSTALMPKLAYNVKLTTSLDLLNVLGVRCPYVTSSGKATCDKSKTYILLANYDDKTLLRDWSASALANAIPIGNGYLDSPGAPSPSGTSVALPWAPHSVFVELYLDGVYEGNYQLIETVKVDSHKVNIDALSQTDISSSQVTGGYLMEIDTRQDEAYVFTTPHGVPIGLIDPDFSPDPEVPEQTSYISAYVNAAEAALFASNFTDPTQGWRAYFDEAAAINFYIVNDVMGNVDGGQFFSSDYLYKNANNPLLYMGPIWDFDISSGNVNYAPIVDPTIPWMQINASWYAQWFTDPGFKADVVRQWNKLTADGVFTAWLASIRAQADTLRQSQANNFGRWPMQGIEIWPNPEAAGSYDGEVGYFTNWLKLRIAYLDSLFNNKPQTQTTLALGTGTLRSGSPVTLTAQVTGVTTPTGIVSFLSNGVLLGSGALDGGGTASLVAGSLATGTDNVQAVYNGDSNSGLSASPGLALTVASPLASTVTSLAGPFTTGFSVSVIGNSGAALPGGTVVFTVDQGSGVAVTVDGGAQASFSPGPLTPGAHTISASYSGDANYSASSGTPIVFHTGSTPINPGAATVASVLSAASYADSPLVAEGYSVAFGAGFSTQSVQAATVSPLPTTLGNVTVTVTDLQGNKAQAGLYYVSPTQINFVVPEGLAAGPASVTISNSAGQSEGFGVNIGVVAPALFTSDASGKGAAAALALVFGSDNSLQASPPVYSCGGTPVVCTTVPIDVSAPGTRVYLSLYGTGIRGLGSLSDILVTLGGVPATVTYAGAQSTYPGLDQVNVLIPPSLAGKGEIALQVAVKNVSANSVLVNIR